MQYFEDTDIASKVNKIFVVTSARSYLNVVTSDSALVEPIPPKLVLSHKGTNYIKKSYKKLIFKQKMIRIHLYKVDCL